jgi:epoxyqueuosine reductase
MNSSAPSNEAALSSHIKEEAQRLGFGLVGISPVAPPPHEQFFAQWLRAGFAGKLDYMQRTELLRRDPAQLVPWAVSVISVGLNYNTDHRRPEAGARNTGWISRYAWGDDYHSIMHQRLESLLDRIRVLNERPVQGKAFVDSGPVLERDAAGIAGLGWIGKNTHLISPKEGSWFFLAELFVDLPLTYDRPIRDRCGRCDLCIKECPTGAFVGPYILDARRCISYLTIELKGWIPRSLRPLIGNHIFGCDICQEICPYNAKAPTSSEPAFAPRAGLYAPQLIPFLALDEKEFRQRFSGSPVLRAKRRGLLRNVAVALGNLRSTTAVPALIGALRDQEALIRGHAAWALGEIGNREATAHLERALKSEQDSEARDEMGAAIAALNAADGDA